MGRARIRRSRLTPTMYGARLTEGVGLALTAACLVASSCTAGEAPRRPAVAAPAATASTRAAPPEQATAGGPADPPAASMTRPAVADAAEAGAETLAAPPPRLELIEALTDRTRLGAAFRRAGYRPPDPTFLLVATVEAGAGEPALRYYSLGDSGLIGSAGRYWPASAIKVMAAVGALLTLRERGFDGDATISLSDREGTFVGSLAGIIKQALVISSNTAYNRLMLVAGFDALNERFLGPAAGFQHTALQRLFYEVGERVGARRSPPFVLSEEQRSLQVPARTGHAVHPECEGTDNCTSLLELTEVLRRVVLHDELPPADRLPIRDEDAARLREYLREAHTRMEPGLSEAFGNPVEVYNKTGSVRDDDRLDHGLVVDPASGRRLLIAMSVRYDDTDDETTSDLARQAVRAVLRADPAPAPVQPDAGDLRIARSGDGRVVLSAEGADGYEAWLDGRPVEVADGSLSPGPDARLLVARALRDGVPIAHRTVTLLPP